jgi:hypothetical protein
MKNKPLIISLFSAASVLFSVTNRGDEVTDWNQVMVKAFASATPPVTPFAGPRLGAIIEGAVFDAVNGIDRRYTPFHVPPNAPPGASKRAAAIQAAYATLSTLFPVQKPTFDAQLTTSLNALHGGKNSIANGRAWGQSVADQILAWRATDGASDTLPPFNGGNSVGKWRPTPLANASMVGMQYVNMAPFVMTSPDQFLPPGPPALNSLQYVQDYVETKLMGRSDSAERTADETLYAKFWNSSTVAYFWNTVGQRLSQQKHFGLSKNARFFAHLNVGMADALIGCWNAKVHYIFWRPITAITLGDTDANDDTVAQSTWAPLLVTPPHPDYPSGHSTVSGGATTVLAGYFGVNTSFWIDSDLMPGVIRTFNTLDEARDEIASARIFAGIHFRSACEDGFAQGTSVGNYVLQNSLQPCNGYSGNDDDSNDD